MMYHRSIQYPRVLKHGPGQAYRLAIFKFIHILLSTKPIANSKYTYQSTIQLPPTNNTSPNPHPRTHLHQRNTQKRRHKHSPHRQRHSAAGRIAANLLDSRVRHLILLLIYIKKRLPRRSRDSRLRGNTIGSGRHVFNGIAGRCDSDPSG